MALQAVDGGSGNVNGDFEILTQEPGILLQAGNKVVDAVTVYAQEKAFNVPFTFTVPTSTWQGEEFVTYTRVIASYIQEIAQYRNVVAIYSTPDTDPAGLLQDYLFVTVGIAGTDSTAEVKILQSQSNTTGAFAAIDATYNQLVTNQNAGGPA
jgi:hypothetical protein